MKILYTLACALLISLPACAQDTPQAKAASLYAKGQFKDAALAYAQAVKETPDNPYLHYNMGNAYYKASSLGQAVACYWRAFRLNPRNSAIRHNLELALKNSGVDFIPPGVPSSLYLVFEIMSRREIGGTAMALMWIGLLLASAAIFHAPARRLALKPAIICLCGFAGFGLWWLARGAADTNNPAIVVNGIAEVKSGPLETANALATVPEGHMVEILDQKDNWYEVGISKEGIKGWIKGSSLEAL